MDAFKATGSSRPNHWVVLIGVGFTVGRGEGGAAPTSDRSLKGAVSDVRAVHEYFQSMPSPADVIVLTATKSPDGNQTRPLETRDSLASYDNVTSSFKRILDQARQGDHVYIHYSGHGSRRLTDRAMALELLDPETFQTQYIYGTVLRNAIKRMIENDLDVTLVLDCCFSGSALRAGQMGDAGLRYLEHDPNLDILSNLTDPWGDAGPVDVVRDADICFARLLDPNRYTILAASGPDQFAFELDFEGGGLRGALTYFLVSSLITLRRRGTHVSNQTLHQHLRAQFHAHVPQQTPMLYGNHGFSFFGDFTEGLDQPPIAHLHRSQNDGHVTLHAGQAHGVHLGDKYALSPFDTRETYRALLRGAIEGTVSAVGSIESRLTIDPKDIDRIRAGSAWKAVLVTSLSSRKIRFRLDSNVPGREELVKASKKCPTLILLDASDTGAEAGESAAFHVSMDTPDTYQVQTAAAKVIYASPIKGYVHHQTAKTLLATLTHLANYKFLEGIENQLPSPEFESSFLLRTEAKPAKDGYYCVSDNKDLTLLFENRTDHPLYLSIFIFTAQWEVRNLASEKGEDACLTVSPKGVMEDGKFELPLTMWIPPELRTKGFRQTEDVVKVVVTKKPPAFPGYLLRRLGQDARMRSTSDPVQKFLQALNGDLRCEMEAPFNWTTRNYLIRTYID